jgi:hypothetical protein
MSDIRPTDDHPEGGLYIDEHDFWINANGEYVDAHGKKVDKPVKANAPKPDSRPAKTTDQSAATPTVAIRKPDEK